MSSPYKLEGSAKANHYYFTSRYGLRYFFHFLPGPEHFSPKDPLQSIIFEFGFGIDAEERLKLPKDSRVKDTVIFHIDRFFENKDNVLYYICDSTDNKHYSRKRLFDRWFLKYDNQHFEKHDYSIPVDINIPPILVSVIFFKNHPLKKNIIDFFESRMEEYTDLK